MLHVYYYEVAEMVHREGREELSGKVSVIYATNNGGGDWIAQSISQEVASQVAEKHYRGMLFKGRRDIDDDDQALSSLPKVMYHYIAADVGVEAA